MLRAALLCVMPFAVVTRAEAQALAEDFSATAINEYAVRSLNVYGNAKAELIDRPALPGGKALRVAVAAKGENPWDAGVVSKVSGAVKAGDELAFVFFAKLVSSDDGATSITLPSNNVALSSPPYTGLFGAPATIGTGWKRLRQRFTADRDYAPGTLQAAIHLATGKQVIELGPIFVSRIAAGLPEPANITAMQDLSSKVINDVSSPEVNGAKAQLVDDTLVSGGKALRVTVTKKGLNNWDSNVRTWVKKPIRKGDKLLLMFDARLQEGSGGSSNTEIYAAVQVNAAPYSALVQGSPQLTTKWQSYRYEGVADKDYGANAVMATISVGNARQKIDFGPITVVNLGQ